MLRRILALSGELAMGWLRRFLKRPFVRRFAILCGGLWFVSLGMNLVPPPRCLGTDIMVEFQRNEPAAYIAVMTEARATPNTQAVLWRIEKPGVPTSHLFGTVHLTDERLTRLTPAVTEALDRSRMLAIEIADLNPGFADIASFQTKMRFQDSTRLDQLLSPSEFAQVLEVLVQKGVSAGAVRQLRPWAVSSTVGMPACEIRRQAHGLLFLDAMLKAEAQRRKLPVIGLETFSQQLEAFSGNSDADEAQMLSAGLPVLHRIDDQIEALVQLYLNRQLGVVGPALLHQAAKAGVSREVFKSSDAAFIKRNLVMRDNALPQLAAGGLFVAVGALHLPGHQGLVELFRKAGYSVTAIE
jgi:uncharacterized protein